MRERIVITPVTSVEQIAQLKPWLESFDHKVPVSPAGRFHLFSKGDRILALTQQTTLNALFPAVNPKVCTPRETSEIADCFRSWSANLNGGLSVSVPIGSPMHEQMGKLGYKPVSVLYESIAEDSPQQ